MTPLSQFVRWALRQNVTSVDPNDHPEKPGATQAPTVRGAARVFALESMMRVAMVWVLMILAVISEILYPGFFNWGNIRNLLDQNASTGLVAVGMTVVIIGAGFDLSVGGFFALGGVLFASFANHVPIVPAFIGALLVAMFGGAMNGIIITRFRVNPFVATLGSGSIVSGLTYYYVHNELVTPKHLSFTYIGTAAWGTVPVSVVMLTAAFVVGGIVLGRTAYGFSVYATGGNFEASRLAGMRVDLVRASTYVVSAGCAALAGMLSASRTDVGQPNVGQGVTLDAIAIVIIGGTSLFGGEGAMWRSAIGLLILAAIDNLFTSLNVDPSLQMVIKGAVIIGAVGIDAWLRGRRS